MDAVKACPLDPPSFVHLFSEAARARGFREDRFAEIASVPLAAYTRRTPGRRPRIYISAGIHGDEPAPPRALLAMLESDLFDERATWFLCPLLNPTGFARRIRENADGLDLNRDYIDLRSAEITGHVRWLRNQPAFDVVFCLHEDWESAGFYIYELNSLPLPSLAAPMINAARRHLPIEDSPMIDGRESSGPGLIRPQADPLLRETWPEAVYLHAKHCALNYTLETPSALPIEKRIAAHTAAVQAGLDAFFKDWASRRPAR